MLVFSCRSSHADCFLLSRSPTPLSPARYPSLSTQDIPQLPQPDRSSLRTTQPYSSSSSRCPNAVPSAPFYSMNPTQRTEISRQPSFDPRFPNEAREGDETAGRTT